MLYKIGLALLLMSAAFCGGSVLVPLAVAGAGIILMGFGRREA